MAAIKTLDFMNIILPLLLEVRLDENNLQIEENPYAWARVKNLPNIKEGMIGYSLSEKYFGRKLIVLKYEISGQEQEDAIQRIIYEGDRGRKYFLSIPERFIEHLVRHEIEHCVFGRGQGQEHEADKEALQKMGFIPKKTGF